MCIHIYARSRHVSVTAGGWWSSGTGVFSADVANINALLNHAHNLAATGSISITVRGARLGVMAPTLIARASGTLMAASVWTSGTSSIRRCILYAVGALPRYPVCVR